MLYYTLKRIGFVIPVAFFVVSAVFLCLRLLPGNPADLVLGEQAEGADKAAWLALHGLDAPVSVQYARFVGGVVSGDLGRSFASGVPVSELVRERYPATLELALTAMAIGMALAFPLGMWGATHWNKWPDHASRILSLVGISVPTLFLGPLLMLVFAVYLGWFPVSGRALPGSSVLPSVALGLAMAAFLSRIVRATLIDVLHQDFIRTAKAKGLSTPAVFWKHALKAALVPIVSVIALQFGALLAGAVVTEKIFAWPGMGSLLIDAIGKRDYAVVQACILVLSLSYVAVNTAADLVLAAVDPRISHGPR